MIAHTITPPRRPTHNEVYVNAFIKRCQGQGWTSEQILGRLEPYYGDKEKARNVLLSVTKENEKR